ncbi:MAG: hypothetical protein ABJA86_10460 [Nocardioidaceae bacterium]
MIVRIMGEGQWEVSAELLQELNSLDAALESAVALGDETTFRTSLDSLLDLVRDSGQTVADEELVDSDLILPPADATIQEVRGLLGDEGLIPG